MEAARDLVLSTKTLKPRLSSLLRQRPGIRFREEDFIRIAPVVDPGGLSDLDPQTALIFTSANAISIASGYYAAVRNFSGVVYTLDGPGKEEAKAALPKARIRSAGHNGAELAQFISGDAPPENLTFFCGNMRRDTLPETLKARGFKVRDVLTYETGLAPHQVQEVPAAILFFSPSAVESYLMANHLSRDSVCVTIGATTADLLRRQQYGLRIHAAPVPSQEAVVDTLLNYLNTTTV